MNEYHGEVESMGKVVIGHNIVIFSQKGNQSLRDALSEIQTAKLCSSQHLYTEINQITHLVFENWKI
jgi:hypothetical protein